jgi:hypothetical protein
MKIRRLTCIELLQTLRNLDGVTVNGQVQAFKFEPAVIEKFLENILVLRKIKEDADVYSDELKKKLSGNTPMQPAHPRFAEFQEMMGSWLAVHIDMNLMLLTRDDLNLKDNRIPITFRECLLPIMAPATATPIVLPAPKEL